MKNLIKVAEELIDVLGLVEKDEEPIELDPNISKKDLTKFIKDGAKLIDPEGDDFSKETIESLKKMNLWPGQEDEDKEEEKPAKKGKKPAPKKEEETPDEDDDDMEDDDEDEEPKEEKPAKKGKKPANKKPVEKKETTKKVVKKSRMIAICDCVKKLSKKGMTIEDLATEANELLIENGGLDNQSQTKHTLRVIIPVLVEFEIINVDNEKIIPNQK